MIGDGNAMRPRTVRFEDDVAAFLIHTTVAIMFTEQLDELRSVEIARQLSSDREHFIAHKMQATLSPSVRNLPGGWRAQADSRGQSRLTHPTLGGRA
jgi:hypothetical protein